METLIREGVPIIAGMEGIPGHGPLGWMVLAALGGKLAAPDRQVVGLVGGGDFLMTAQKLATAEGWWDVPVPTCLTELRER